MLEVNHDWQLDDLSGLAAEFPSETVKVAQLLVEPGFVTVVNETGIASSGHEKPPFLGIHLSGWIRQDAVLRRIR
jgi:hypothetical protein